MDRRKVGHAVIINNLDEEQTPTKKDVEAMGQVLKTIGLEIIVTKTKNNFDLVFFGFSRI